ncbi:hypothetical protein [Pararhizobium haloflavum]|uniref:hypothetical protein n=1 Tax=Pararhizobium haloflavum TaxID=2037914 RepID=UPI001FDFDD65|nr:hypothetical protein [Pararhizobium haloflavum]
MSDEREMANEPLESSAEKDPIKRVLAAHQGDTRAAIAGLLADVDYLQQRLAYASLTVSYGFVRGWLPTHERLAR